MPPCRWSGDGDWARCAGSAAAACDASSAHGRKRGGSARTANGEPPHGLSAHASGWTGCPGRLGAEPRGAVLPSSCHRLCAASALQPDDVAWESSTRPSFHRACRTCGLRRWRLGPFFPGSLPNLSHGGTLTGRTAGMRRQTATGVTTRSDT